MLVALKEQDYLVLYMHLNVTIFNGSKNRHTLVKNILVFNLDLNKSMSTSKSVVN